MKLDNGIMSRKRKGNCGRVTKLTEDTAKELIRLQADAAGTLSYERLRGELSRSTQVTVTKRTIQVWCDALYMRSSY